MSAGCKKFSTFVQNPVSIIVREGLILMPGARALTLSEAFTDIVHTDLSQRSPVTAGLQTQRPESQGPEMPAGSQSHLESLGKRSKKVRSQFLTLLSQLKSAALSGSISWPCLLRGGFT